MHIEPGIVDGAKIVLSYGTAVGAAVLGGKMVGETIRECGVLPVALRSLITTALVFSFFEILPHHPVGVSEVHFILGSTLLLLFGAGPAAIGLAVGLLLQGIFFAPTDLPQYGMNVTTLLVPLFGINLIAKRIIAPQTPYVDLTYRQALALSTAFQGGIVSWVAFWALYGRGLNVEALASISTFGAAYMSVVIIEPLADLALLALVKAMRGYSVSSLFTLRLHKPA